jgi:hypothetical protein
MKLMNNKATGKIEVSKLPTVEWTSLLGLLFSISEKSIIAPSTQRY